MQGPRVILSPEGRMLNSPSGSGGPSAQSEWRAKPGAWVDLALTLPIFLVYHLGVIFLHIRNASDLITAPLLQLAEGDRLLYLAITGAIGVVFAGVFGFLGRGEAFRTIKFLQVLVEGVVYAIVMRVVAANVVGRLFAGPSAIQQGPFTGVVMSMGAGFYEELAFRVILFGLGAKLLVRLFARERMDVVRGTRSRFSFRSAMVVLAWGIVSAAIFSGVHYVGALGDPFELSSFTFRFVLGAFLSLVYVTRGFSVAVWTHALYDVWVLVL